MRGLRYGSPFGFVRLLWLMQDVIFWRNDGLVAGRTLEEGAVGWVPAPTYTFAPPYKKTNQENV